MTNPLDWMGLLLVFSSDAGIGSEVSNAVLDFFKKGRMLTQINSTIVHLVPKGLNPTSLVLRGALRRVLLTPPRIDWRQWVIRVSRGQMDLAKERRRYIGAAVYALWQERNRRIFSNQAAVPERIIRWIVGVASF
ncbi:hypothetical protein Dimus_024139 [Dionaea muscipula]